ncbi:UNVERIFIED_CONTAM: hypothetical protein GTU68_043119 [Idotea baltica]|nr:hypothetical protein [Idotea baltica]
MEFNLEVNQGEILSVIGPSGSGKTTLLNLVAGFIKPCSGQVLVNDVDISHLEISQRPVTTVFQENNLFPHLDVFTNIALGLRPSLKLNSNETQQIQEALNSVGLNNFNKRYPKELSGGQRQRVALARALVRRHSILLLDEPLAALGPAMREEIIDLLKELVHREKMCALLISHQPEDALKASARTAFINEGKVLLIEDSEKLLLHSDVPEIRQYLGES